MKSTVGFSEQNVVETNPLSGVGAQRIIWACTSPGTEEQRVTLTMTTGPLLNRSGPREAHGRGLLQRSANSPAWIKKNGSAGKKSDGSSTASPCLSLAFLNPTMKPRRGQPSISTG